MNFRVLTSEPEELEKLANFDFKLKFPKQKNVNQREIFSKIFENL